MTDKTPRVVFDFLHHAYSKAFHELGLYVTINNFIPILSRWEEKHRHYHTVEHLLATVAWVNEWVLNDSHEALASHFDGGQKSPLKVDNRPKVIIALFYHDAVYDVHAKDNEDVSARVAARELSEFGASEELIAEIVNLIDITKHVRPPQTEDERLILDADLSSLGAPRPKYEQNSKNIRKEYLWVDLDVYRKNRISFLTRMLERGKDLFHTAKGKREFLAQATTNMRVELTELRALRRAFVMNTPRKPPTIKAVVKGNYTKVVGKSSNTLDEIMRNAAPKSLPWSKQ